MAMRIKIVVVWMLFHLGDWNHIFEGTCCLTHNPVPSSPLNNIFPTQFTSSTIKREAAGSAEMPIFTDKNRYIK
jgi:hypothetical protein